MLTFVPPSAHDAVSGALARRRRADRTVDTRTGRGEGRGGEGPHPLEVGEAGLGGVEGADARGRRADNGVADVRELFHRAVERAKHAETFGPPTPRATSPTKCWSGSTARGGTGRGAEGAAAAAESDTERETEAAVEAAEAEVEVEVEDMDVPSERRRCSPATRHTAAAITAAVSGTMRFEGKRDEKIFQPIFLK